MVDQLRRARPHPTCWTRWSSRENYLAFLLGSRNVRKVLYDRADLDRLVELSRVV